MGAVAEAVSDVVSDIVQSAGDAVSDVGQAVEQVGQTVGNVAENIAQDPIPTLITIAATVAGVPPPLTAAAITAAQGGSIEQIALSAAASYAGGQVAGEVGGALADAAPVIADIVPSAAQGATQAIITGQDPLTAALASGVAGGVSGQVTPEFGQTAGTILGQTAGNVAAGGDLEQALGTSIASNLIGQGTGQISSALTGTGTQPTDVAAAPQDQTMDEILAGMIAEELQNPSTPSPYAPVASGGVASDVTPTPLVPSGPVGTVTAEFVGVPEIEGEGIAFEDLPPIEEPEYQPPISEAANQIYNVVQGAGGQQPAPPISAGPVTQPTTPTTGGGGGISQTDQDLLDLINAVEGGGATQETATAGGGTGAGTDVSGESMGVAETTPTPEDEGELIDTGPREPAETAETGGIDTTVVMGPRSGAVRGARPRFAPSDTTLSALLGTSLTPSAGASEPIMGEDESRRRGVWNIESLRNALGI
jgi:hypothetical protein